MPEREPRIENNNQVDIDINSLNQEGIIVLEQNDSFLGSLGNALIERFRPFSKRMALPAAALIIAIAAACAREDENPEEPQDLADHNPAIAFHSNRDGNWEIYVINPDGSGLKNVTNNPDRDDFFPNNPWSPDGSRLVYMSKKSGEDGKFDIFVVNADGKNLRQLTDHPEDDTYPIWSPDGRQIAFISERNTNNEIYVVEPDGSGLKNLTKHPATDGIFTLAWSPDSKRIAFTSDRGRINGLYTMKADGSDIKLLVKGDLSEHILDLYWSPDGKYIAFEDLITMLGNEILLVKADGGAFVQINKDIPSGVNARWSPNSKLLAFDYDSGFIACERDIYLINSDGSSPINLTNNSEFCNSVGSWSPDGKKIVFTSDRDGNNEIYVMNTDGSGMARLTNHPADDSRPYWSPQ